MSETLIVNSETSLNAAIKQLMDDFAKHRYARVKIEPGQSRTDLQNRALHKYCAMLAEALNDAGLDMLKVLKPGAEIPWSQPSVKEQLWRPIQVAMLDKESTTEAKTFEYGQVYEVLNRHIAQKFGVSVPWPCRKEKE